MSDRPGGLSGVVAIGASAGGVEALTQVAAGLSSDLPYAYLMALHMPAASPSVLPSIVDRRSPLPAVAAEQGTQLEPGHIYVAVPNHHLLVAGHRIALSRGPTENGHRPAINALFRSVALAFGPHAIGVLLSGVLDDGVSGLGTIRARGGVTVAQTPRDALFPALPANAAAAGVLDHQVSAADVGTLLQELARRTISHRNSEPDTTLELENQIAMASQFATHFDTDNLGPASGYTCPDCNGSLAALGHDHFRCRVGHAWSPESLLTARDDEIETALWVALRSLREKAELARRMAGRAGHGPMYRRYTQTADEAERALTVLGDRLGQLTARHGDAGD